MALRLRRGTDAERLLVTPLQGELVYATDTKKIYVGDGAIAGGVLIGPTDADAFTSVISDTTPQLGGGLDLNSNNITGTGSINITGSIHATGNITSDGDIGLGNEDSDIINVNGVINSSLRPALDSQYDIGTDARKWRKALINSIESTEITATEMYADRISGNDSTVLWNSTSDTLTVGIANVTTLNVAGTITAATFNGNMSGNLLSDDSTALIDANTKTATFRSITAEAGALNGVSIGLDSGTPRQDITANNIISLTGFTGNLEGQVTGRVTGDVYGSIQGSVFGGDSTLIIDDTTSTVLGNVNNSTTTSKQVNSATINLSGRDDANLPAGVLITTTDTYADGAQFSATAHADVTEGLGMQLARFRGTEGSPAGLQVGDEIGTMLFIGGDSAGIATPAAAFKVEVNDTPVAGNVKAGFWIATQNAAAGNALTPALELTSSQGANFYGPAKLYSFADTTARDAAIATPAAGMMIYLTATNKAQVYNGTAWTDLH